MFLSRYQDRPSTLKVDHHIGGERKGTVHSLNEFNVTVWEDGEVTAQRKYYASSEPGRHFPNMSVSDGAITLPIEDLVGFILARISAEELAEGIMSDDEARAALVEKMSERYSSPTFEDQDRREFLTKVQQQVYAKAIDRAIERLNKSEEAHRSRDDYYRWRKVEIGHYRGVYEAYQHALYELREAGKLDDDGVLRRLSTRTTPDDLDKWISEARDPVVKESVGPQWTESRDFWRKRLEEFFPEPASSEVDPDEGLGQRADATPNPLSEGRGRS